MAYFNFTINGHTYSNDPASGLAYGYKFNGYEYIPALGNLFTDLAATVATVLGYKNAAQASRDAAQVSEDNAHNSAVDANYFATAAASAAAGLQGTSTTSLAISTGTKVFTTQAGKQLNNTWVLATDAGNVNNWMFGYATYSGTSLSLAVASGDTGGSGTIASWVLAVNGPRGVTGATGATGTIGALQSATDFAYDAATSTGLNLGTKAGDIRSDNTTTHHAATTTALTNNTTNYVEVNTSGVSANTTGFTAGSFPICTAVTLSGAITTVTDKRGIAVLTAAAGAVVPIGGLIAMSQTANQVTINGIDYLKTGVLAAAGSYTSAPLQNVFTDAKKNITSGDWVGVANGGGITVAVASGSATGQISYDNGYTWSPITMPNAGYKAICYGAGIFVAVGASVCATSSDGVDWTARTIGANTWQAVINDGTNFVAVSGTGTAGTYSADGITWYASTLPASLNWSSLCFGGGLILATHTGAISSAAASSADHGQTWTARTLSIAYNNYAGNCAYGAGLFVVNQRDNGGGSTSNISTSADCVTWATRNLGVSFSEVKTLSFAAGLFLLTKATTKTCYTSPDGINWTPRTGVATHAATSVCVANGGRVIGVQGGSTTGIDIFNLAYGRGYHIALFADPQNQGLPNYMRMN